MTGIIKLSSDQKKDWETIASIDANALKEAAKDLKESPETLFSGPEVKEFLMKRGFSEEIVFSLVRQLMSLRSHVRRSTKSLDDLISALYRGFEVTFENDKNTKTKLGDIQPEIEALIKTESIEIASKAHSLGVDHDSSLLSSYIVSDIRPIFRNNREEIIGGIVVNYLKLEVAEHGRTRIVSYVLDEADINKLIEQLQDAKKKTESLSRMIKESLKLRAFVVGDDSIGLG